MIKRRQLIAAAGVTAAAIHSGKAQAQEVKLRIVHVLSTTEPAHEACELLAKRVGERSGGAGRRGEFLN